MSFSRMYCRSCGLRNGLTALNCATSMRSSRLLCPPGMHLTMSITPAVMLDIFRLQNFSVNLLIKISEVCAFLVNLLTKISEVCVFFVNLLIKISEVCVFFVNLLIKISEVCVFFVKEESATLVLIDLIAMNFS